METGKNELTVCRSRYFIRQALFHKEIVYEDHLGRRYYRSVCWSSRTRTAAQEIMETKNALAIKEDVVAQQTVDMETAMMAYSVVITRLNSVTIVRTFKSNIRMPDRELL